MADVSLKSITKKFTDDSVARIPPQVKVDIHQDRKVTFDMDRLHIFNTETDLPLL